MPVFREDSLASAVADGFSICCRGLLRWDTVPLIPGQAGLPEVLAFAVVA